MCEGFLSRALSRSTNDPASLARGEAAEAGDAMAIRAAAGAALGLAWGAALRGWMVVLALQFGERPHFTWKGTFGGILLPTAVMGALLGIAASAQAPSARKRSQRVILSPLLLVLGPAIFTDNFIPTLIKTGLGGGAIGVALTGLSGGYALSGTGPRWLRRAAGVLAVLLGVGPGVGFAFVGGGSTGTPNRVFGGLLFALLMGLLVAGIGAATRERSSQGRAEGKEK